MIFAATFLVLVNEEIDNFYTMSTSIKSPVITGLCFFTSKGLAVLTAQDVAKPDLFRLASL